MKQWTINLSFLAVVMGFTAFSNNYFFTYVAKKNVHGTRVAFLTRCLEMDSEFFDKNSPNEMAAKLMINAEELYDGTGSTVALGFQLMFGALGAFIAILYISPLLFLAFFGFMIVTATVLGVIFSMWINGMNAAKAAYGQANGYADQALSSVKVV
jgi:ABC-type multidrug transport system fused ATPase/permease subunit